jgi:hypothetical protein
VELACLSAGLADGTILTEAEATERATWAGRIEERMREYLTDGDSE